MLINIGSSACAIEVKPNLEKGLLSGMFNSCVAMIPGPGIMFLDPVDNNGGHIITVIGNMGINMMPISIIMGNHFPTVIATMIFEVGMPLAICPAPLRVTCVRIVSLKCSLYACRGLLVPVLRKQGAAGGQSNQGQK